MEPLVTSHLDHNMCPVLDKSTTMIGPEIPAHLLKRSNSTSDSDDECGPQPGPQIPAHLLQTRPSASRLQVFDDDDNEGRAIPSIGPSIPPELLAASSPRAYEPQPVAGPSRPAEKLSIGPSLPNYGPTYNSSTGGIEDDDSDDDIGPKPLPAGMHHEETDAVKEFLASEEKRRKLAEVCFSFFKNVQLCLNTETGSCQTKGSSAGGVDARSTNINGPSIKYVPRTSSNFHPSIKFHRPRPNKAKSPPILSRHSTRQHLQKRRLPMD